MKEYTFAIITYNQERMVLEQLESIKYQISHYGKGYKIDLLVCDDSSKDRTVDSITKWTEINNALFSNIRIYSHEKNLGTVANYIFALKEIKTASFKLLAGDDLYSFRSVFAFDKPCGILLTPTLKFDGNNILHKDLWFFYKELVCTPEKKWKKLIKNRIKFQMPFETPGVFWSSDLISVGLFQALSKYHWIEDIPVWNYLINQDKTTVYFSLKPLVLYRTNSGISLNQKHEKRTLFDDELEEIRKDIMVRKNGLSKCINIYTYVYWLRRKVLFRMHKDKMSQIASEIEKEERLAKEFVDKIVEAANQFYVENIN